MWCPCLRVLHCPLDRGVHNGHNAKYMPTPETRAGRRSRTRSPVFSPVRVNVVNTHPRSRSPFSSGRGGTVWCPCLRVLQCPQDRGVHNGHNAKYMPTPETRAGRRSRTRRPVFSPVRVNVVNTHPYCGDNVSIRPKDTEQVKRRCQST